MSCLISGSRHTRAAATDIVDVLTDLLNKVQSETSDTRHDEFSAAHNFATLKQFLENKLTQDTKVLKKAKTEFAAALAAEKTDLAEASKSLVSLKTSQAASQSTCSQVTSDHEISVKDFAEECSFQTRKQGLHARSPA